MTAAELLARLRELGVSHMGVALSGERVGVTLWIAGRTIGDHGVTVSGAGASIEEAFADATGKLAGEPLMEDHEQFVPEPAEHRLRDFTVPGTLVTFDNGERGVIVGRDDDDFGDFVVCTMLGRRKRSAVDRQRYRFKADEVVRMEAEPRETGTLFLVCQGRNAVSVANWPWVVAAFHDKREADEMVARHRRRRGSDSPLVVRVGRYTGGRWRSL